LLFVVVVIVLSAMSTNHPTVTILIKTKNIQMELTLSQLLLAQQALGYAVVFAKRK